MEKEESFELFSYINFTVILVILFLCLPSIRVHGSRLIQLFSIISCSIGFVHLVHFNHFFLLQRAFSSTNQSSSMCHGYTALIIAFVRGGKCYEFKDFVSVVSDIFSKEDEVYRFHPRVSSKAS